MKSRVSLALGLAVLLAACAQQPDRASLSNLGVLGSHPTNIRIEHGDTLFGLAHRYDMPIRSIIEANGLVPPYRLEVGRTLILPSADSPLPPDSAVATAAPVTRSAARRQGTARKVAATAHRPALGDASARIESSEVDPPAVAQAGAPPQKAPPAAVKSAAAMMAPTARSPDIGDALHRFVWPVHGRVVEGYGSATNGTHNDGINIAARAGSPVFAAAAGEVVYVGNELRGYGNLVLIKHDGGYLTAYAHNSALLVHKGEHVARGQTIARVGSTGQVHEPQLHFEIRAGRNPVDPTPLLPPIQQASAARD
jgi:murein DD-endopeptidase MepM/ murein hydrolase activator NlpD